MEKNLLKRSLIRMDKNNMFGQPIVFNILKELNFLLYLT